MREGRGGGGGKFVTEFRRGAPFFGDLVDA